MELHILEASDVENVISRMKPEEIDKLAFGAINLDSSGKIIYYNTAEGDITGRNPKAMIGKNFFSEVAPCTNKPAFHGVFEKGVKAGKLDAVFDYTFDYNMQPTKVRIHMKQALTGGSYWIFVHRLPA